MLEVENLTVAYTHHGKMVKALQNVSFHIHKGETYGLVGESGAGKTTLALSLLRCHTHGLVMEQGSIRFKHQELFELSSRELRSLWGKELAFMPQDALAALNPSLRIGEQIEEVLRYQLGLNRQEAKQSALDWLGKVQLTDMLHIADSYPHQLSGGMQQRVMLAMVLAARPSLLILDEPTTNLDLTTQAALLSLLKRLINEQHITTLYISHNLKVIANFCTRVGVLFSGELVEEGETKALFASPYHPYTQGLLASSPLLGVNIQQQRLTPMLPGKAGEQNGCSFFARCALAEVSCYQHPIMKEVSPARKVRCPHWQEITAIDKKLPKLNATQPGSGRDSGLLPLLKVERFSVEYPSPNRFPFINQLKHKPRRALTEITLEAYRGRTLGIVGESGSGKTTLARAIMGLIQENTCKNPAQRLQLWAQQDYIVLPQQSKQRDSTILRCLQMVFQNSDETLNPYLTVGEMLQRPFMRLLHQPAEEAMQNSRAMLQSVMLPEEYATRYPHQLSGGEKQRVTIARALVSMPLILICDEAVSALDNTVQAFILNLLHDLRESYHFSLLLISHDLAVISYLADEIVVMLQGYVVERSARESFFSFPHHPYTATAVEKVFMDDVVPSNMQQTQNLALPDGGCFYAAQCARKVEVEKGLSSSALCTSQKPPWVEAAQANKHIYCHYPVE